MRTDREFVEAYAKLLYSVDPAAREIDRDTLRGLTLTDLCLHLLACYLPGEDVGALPYLMLGYPRVMFGYVPPNLAQALTSARHLASRYVSVSAWLDACRLYSELPETLRCYAIRERTPSRRNAAPTSMLALLNAQLTQPPPWVTRKLNVAAPGEALVRTNRGETLLAYQVPNVPSQSAPTHALARRHHNPPIRITMAELQAVAERVDAFEAQAAPKPTGQRHCPDSVCRTGSQSCR